VISRLVAGELSANILAGLRKALIRAFDLSSN
jgi:hypothetical protein